MRAAVAASSGTNEPRRRERASQQLRPLRAGAGSPPRFPARPIARRDAPARPARRPSPPALPPPARAPQASSHPAPTHRPLCVRAGGGRQTAAGPSSGARDHARAAHRAQRAHPQPTARQSSLPDRARTARRPLQRPRAAHARSRRAMSAPRQATPRRLVGPRPRRRQRRSPAPRASRCRPHARAARDKTDCRPRARRSPPPIAGQAHPTAASPAPR